MKKLIYSAAMLFVSLSAFAQKTVVQGKPGHTDATTTVGSPVNTKATLGKASVSSWYDPIDWLNSFTGGGSTVTTFVDFLMPDSTAIFVNEGDTAQRFYSIAVGQIVDPRDNVIDLTDDPGIKLTKFNGYNVDSVYLSYLYVRNVDSIDDGMGGKMPVVDTLIIRYFLPSALTFRSLTATPPFVFAEVAWNMSQLSPTGFVAEEKVLLTRNDSTIASNNNGGFENAWRTKTLTRGVPSGVVVPAQGNTSSQNVAGVTFQFKPGMPYDTGSVLVYQRDPVNFPSYRKRVNYFGYRTAQNAQTATQWRSTTNYNHSLFSDKENAYYASGTINNGWDGFIPGNAFFAGRNIFCGFHFTSGNASINDIKNSTFAMTNVYPNPASVNGTAVAGFNMKQAGNVKITLVNIVGQEVKSLINKSYASGEHAVEFDLSGLNAGVYFVNMTVNGVSETRKLTIAE